MSRTVKNVLYTILPLIMFLFATVMVVGIFAATTASVSVEMNIQYEVPKGSGTVSDPYIIESLGSNSDSAKRGTFNYYARNNMFTRGTYFKQTEDITISDSVYLTNLGGTYNGNGHTITVTGATTPLFDTITGTLKNVTIINENSTADAGVCLQLGNHSDSNAGTIENVIFKGNITSSSTGIVAGIVLQSDGGTTIRNCGNYANITARNASLVAGIVGYWTGDMGALTIENCFNQGNLTSYSATGSVVGICGSGNGSFATMDAISKCYNTGSLKLITPDGVTEPSGEVCGITNHATSATKLNQVYNYSQEFSGNNVGLLGGYANSTNVGSGYALEAYLAGPSGPAVYYGLFADYSSGITDANISGCSIKTSAAMQTKSTYSGWTFGTYGQATDGWVFVKAKIKVDGVETTLSLPRLWFEELTIVS